MYVVKIYCLHLNLLPSQDWCLELSVMIMVFILYVMGFEACWGLFNLHVCQHSCVL
jgi:hypothetical protein